MTEHLFVPAVRLKKGFVSPVHERYLKDWRESALRQADVGDTAASVCHQATMIDLVLEGKPSRAWSEIMEALLTDKVGNPLAYSEAYGRRLYKFDNQYLQTTVHAIHSRWWIDGQVRAAELDHEFFAGLILARKQSDGLVYDSTVSETVLRHRMKSELTLSMAMSAEILKAAGKLAGNLPLELATNITDAKKCPPLGYMSAEYFRLRALEILGHERLFPVGIAAHIDSCAVGLDYGWCDFSIASKVDAYMGTKKRTQRDKPIHSPVIACHVAALARVIPDEASRLATEARLADYALHLNDAPWDIPPFQMRDIPIPFGADVTPVEAICASHLISISKASR
jgi:hypothetical protein